MSGYTNILMRAISLETAPKFDAFTGVRIWLNDEVSYFSGNETGRVLEANCPWATQTMADGILATVSGFSYQPFNAGGAMLVPIAELGDGVNVGGVYSTLGSIETEFDSMCASSIGAPADEEIDHEYPYLTKQEREVSRKVSLGKSYYGTRITRANGLEVVKTEADGTEKSRAKFNSDVLAFYDDDGVEALYFDAVAKRYRFRGDVEVTGGSMNINGNFIVDEDGNLTINGNINLSGGTIAWGDNLPPSGISAATAERIASTVVTEELVAAPTIMGAKVYGGAYYDSYGGGRLDLSYQNYPFLSFSGDVNGTFREGFSVGIMPDDGYISIGVGNGVAWDSNVDAYWTDGIGWYGDVHALGRHTFDHEAVFAGTVDFSGATITGLDIVFG